MLTRLLRTARQHTLDYRLHRILSTLHPEILDEAKPRLLDCLRPLFPTGLEAQAVALKILNLAMARYHYQNKSAALRSRPIGLVVDPSNSCQLACPGCVHSSGAKGLFDWRPGLLSQERFAKFLERFGPTAMHLTLYNYGEPLLNRETPDFIRLAKRYLLQTTLSTNLSVRHFDAEAYVESGLDYFMASVDGATPEVYRQFRRKGDLGLVFRNLRALVEAKRRLGRSSPTITRRFLIFEHNRHEVPLAAALAQDLGVDEFRASPAWDVSWDEPGIQTTDAKSVLFEFGDTFDAMMRNWNPFPAQLAGSAIEAAFDEPWSTPRESVQSSHPAPSCQWLYKNLTMDAGGRILPCCSSPREEGDLVFAQFPGDASDPFNSARHQAARQLFAGPPESASSSDLFCAHCEFDKTADPSPIHMRNYLQSATRRLLGERNLELLCSW